MLQRGRQQPGQRSRPSSGRTRGCIQPGGGEPERIRDLPDLGLGWNGEPGKVAEQVELAGFLRYRDAGRERLRSGQVPAAADQCAAACGGALVVGRGGTPKVAGGPIPRNPLTVRDCR
jgi:hypothetical protein